MRLHSICPEHGTRGFVLITSDRKVIILAKYISDSGECQWTQAESHHQFWKSVSLFGSYDYTTTGFWRSLHDLGQNDAVTPETLVRHATAASVAHQCGILPQRTSLVSQGRGLPRLPPLLHLLF